MALAIGTRLGPFEILAPIGAGGMGEVYRARDPRLGREVAIKVLPASLAGDPERLRRFEQEARATCLLNHPNILAIYDVGTAGGSPYLVSELLEGETLRERMVRAGLPLRKAIECAVQIAHGLAAAHDKGIVHRDLKPENLFITSEGRIKILDFGLAKLTRPERAVADEATTLALDARTDPGRVLGTIGYMSPEQVRSQPADHRSDIFSLGAILYEMISGKRAFQGESGADTMTAILKEDPPELSATSRNVPPALERVVRHCLEKNPAERFQSARDLAFDLEALSGVSEPASRVEVPAGALSRARRFIAPATWVMLGLLMGAGLVWWLGRGSQPETAALRYLTYSGYDSAPAPSPDGRTIAFTSTRDGQPRIWLKQLAGGGEAALTAGPDDFARFSPDGSMILFVRFEGSRPSLYRMAIVGGEPRRVVEDVTDGDWSPDGRQIGFIRWKSEGARIRSVIGLVDADGGTPREVAQFDDQRLGRLRWSPDGRMLAAVQLVRAGIASSFLLFDLDSKKSRTIQSPPPGLNVSSVAWSGAGQTIIYMQSESASGGVVGSAARGIRHDLKTGAVQTIFWSPSSSVYLDIVDAGRIAFDTRSTRESLREVSLRSAASPEGRWITRGHSSDRQPAYSPDGEWVIFSSNRSGNLDLWEVSTKTGSVRRLTDDPADDWDPAFTPDGKRLLWSSNRGGHFEIWVGDADGSGARQLTRDGVDAENPTATPDGQWVVYSSTNPAKVGLWKIRQDGSDAVRLVTGETLRPAVSPDGRHALYMSRFGSQRVAVRVVRIADGAQVPFEIQIEVRRPFESVGRARWMPDGRAIAFLGQDERGVTGVFVQDFVPGRDTTKTRHPLAGFDPEMATESFGISPDGARITVASWEQLFSLMMAENVLGIQPGRRAAR